MKLPDKVKKARLELTPLLDVIFIVLVFLIYGILGMTVHKGSEINLPESTSAKSVSIEGVSLAIFANGDIELENRKISAASLGDALAKFGSSQNDLRQILIRIYAEPQLEYQRLYNILDVIKAAGYSRISLQAK